MQFEARTYQTELSNQGAEILKHFHWLYLVLEPRVGKTFISLMTAERLGYKSVLFLSKKKALTSILSDYNVLAPSFKITITNYEQAGKLNPGDFDLIIIDEAHNYGTFAKPSLRWKTAKKLCAGKDIIFLSATASPESYSQLYHQLALSSWSPLSQYSNFYKFAKDFVTVKQKHLYGYVINDYSDCDGNKLWGFIKHGFLRYSQAEAGFTAHVNEIFHEVQMSDETCRIYKEIEKNKIYTHGEKVCTINSGADLIGKLSQLASGSLIFDDSPKGIIIDPAKAYFIRDYFATKKIAIYFRYKAEFDLLKEFFPNWTDSPEVFNSGPDYTFLSQIQSGREGVNLSTADELVAFNIDFAAVSYFQMRARIQSKERQGTAPLNWIFSQLGIERRVYKAVTNKLNFTYSYYKTNARKIYTSKIKEEAGSVGFIGS